MHLEGLRVVELRVEAAVELGRLGGEGHDPFAAVEEHAVVEELAGEVAHGDLLAAVDLADRQEPLREPGLLRRLADRRVDLFRLVALAVTS